MQENGGGVRARKGWKESEIDLLKQELRDAAAQNVPLSRVFDRVAKETMRKPNSIRNYYYTVLRKDMVEDESDVVIKRQRSAFIPFSQGEIEHLLEHILCGQAEGKSVRACALELGEGDTSAMLRYQNKYRSMVRTHKDVVQGVIQRMQEQEIPCFDPYEKETEQLKESSETEMAAIEALKELRKITNVDLPAFVESVNMLYDKASVNEQLKRELAAIQQQLDECRQKEQNAVMECEYYRRRLKELTGAVKSYMMNQNGEIKTDDLDV